MKVVISSGHGLKIRGASGYVDEVNEARKAVAEIAEWLQVAGVGVITFNDDTSTTQSKNLETIVAFHNSQQRDLDVSVHFNAYKTTDKPMGTEVCYLSQQELAIKVAAYIAEAGDLIDRGGKKRTDLYFLNHTTKPAILIEVCFVDSSVDAALYSENFAGICMSIAEAISGVVFEHEKIPPIS